MDEIEKPEKCSESDCSNKAYKKDKISMFHWTWVCRKHYYMFNYGYGEQEASYK